MKTPPECDIQEFIVPLAQILGVTVTNPRCGVPFLNLVFTAKPLEGHGLSLIGPGVYGLFFTPPDSEKERLIYIGSFLGEKQDPYGGKIVGTRWWTHAASVTMRGHRISIAERTSSQLAAHLTASPAHDLHHLATPANPGCLHKGKGRDAGRNRVFFAESHWDLFGAADEANILAPFCMAYLRLDSMPTSMPTSMGIATLRAEVERIERQVIAAFLPVCNSQTKWGKARHDVTMGRFVPDVRRRLCDLWPRLGGHSGG